MLLARLHCWTRRLACLLVVSTTATVLTTNAPAQVQSWQKIAQGAGGLSAALGADANFGADFAELGDLNGDGRPEFAVGAHVYGSNQTGVIFILSLNPNGTVFSETTITAAQVGFQTNGSEGIIHMGSPIEAIGDLNNDGVVDLVVGAHYYQGAAASALSPEGAIAILFLNSSLGLSSSTIIAEGRNGFTGDLDGGDFFGITVGNVGDVNGDGIVDIAASAYGDDDGGPERGAVYIPFLNSNGTVSGHQKISDLSGGLASGTLSDSDYFGTPAGVGDMDGNGVPDLVVGAYLDDTGGMDRGAIYVLFLDSAGMVINQSKIAHGTGGLTASLMDGGLFGFPNRNPDLDGDGISELTVGAPAENGTGANYLLFLNPNGTVRRELSIGWNTPGFGGALSPGDSNGYQALVINDLSGDGHPDMLFSGVGDDAAGNNSGAIYVLELEPLASPYPGTDEDFQLSTGLNGAPCTSGGFLTLKDATAGDLLSICVDSPGFSFLGGPILVGAKLSPSGSTISPAFPAPIWEKVWIFPWIPLVDGITMTPGPLGPQPVMVAGGLNFGITIPPALIGQQVTLQAAIAHPAAAVSNLALTEAHLITIQ